MKHILITGGTGFIGKELRRTLLQEGHYLIVITRNPKKYDDEKAKNQQFISWEDDLIPIMNTVDVVIHLAGENVFSQRWSEEVKKKIYDSRIDSTRTLVDAMRSRLLRLLYNFLRQPCRLTAHRIVSGLRRRTEHFMQLPKPGPSKLRRPIKLEFVRDADHHDNPPGPARVSRQGEDSNSNFTKIVPSMATLP